ncbi:sensor histidine kinase [Candidatus Nitrosocosmicus hydrocola]|uniref:sensor histidine kinase n=1 Tax=Candidatus Nitrosocosmicus hydrocola TaxID=1826872 RepID=UPI0011E5B9B9|nr:HAMP domain-containing sensor histidine kinase [Candidatus Nitrosocosmicus hydrocola]
MTGRNDDDSVDGQSDIGKGGATKDDITRLASRSREIRSEIHNLVTDSSLLLQQNKQLQKTSIEPDQKQVNANGKIGTEPFELHTTNKNDDDISKHKILDINRRLVELNEELANIINEIIASNENIREKYEKQQDFINIAAHEIRSPCQAIIGYVELLNLEPADSKKHLDLIEKNAERLSLIISNILDASRIDHKTLKIEKVKFSLVELIEQIIDDLNSRITDDRNQNTQIVFENIQTDNQNLPDASKNTIIYADKGRITQVIFNLLDNAIRYGKGNKIIVALKEHTPIHQEDDKEVAHIESEKLVRLPEQKRLDHGEIIVQVKDSGRGINSKVLDNLFSKFTSDSTAGGTGLGLYISKNIVEAHGGRIWAENNKDQKGATLSFSLPLNLD